VKQVGLKPGVKKERKLWMYRVVNQIRRGRSDVMGEGTAESEMEELVPACG